MVKGVSRRVVVVKSPDQKFFEQAIFLLREEPAQTGAPEEEVLRRAQEVADAYLLKNSPGGRRRHRLAIFGYLLLGAAVASAAWLFVPMFPLPF